MQGALPACALCRSAARGGAEACDVGGAPDAAHAAAAEEAARRVAGGCVERPPEAGGPQAAEGPARRAAVRRPRARPNARGDRAQQDRRASAGAGGPRRRGPAPGVPAGVARPLLSANTSATPVLCGCAQTSLFKCAAAAYARL